jgi:hypothetical protein
VVHPQPVLHCNGITLERAGEQAWVIDLLQQRLTAWRHVAKVAVAVLLKELLQDLQESGSKLVQAAKTSLERRFFWVCVIFPMGEKLCPTVKLMTEGIKGGMIIIWCVHNNNNAVRSVKTVGPSKGRMSHGEHMSSYLWMSSARCCLLLY